MRLRITSHPIHINPVTAFRSTLAVVILMLSFLYTGGNCGVLSWKLESEGGYFRSGASTFDMNNGLLTRFEGALHYKKQNTSNRLDISVRLKPEFYGLDTGNHNTKLFVYGQFHHRRGRLAWQVSASGRKFSFYSNNGDISYRLFQTGGRLYYTIATGWPINFAFNYVFRNADIENRQHLNGFYMQGQIIRNLSKYWQTSAAILFEKFRLSRQFLPVADIGYSQNNGWRAGPEISLEYRKNILLAARYHYLFHKSRFSTRPMGEHWMRFLLAKVIIPRWTLLFLSDFYFLKLPPVSPENLELVFTPVDTENRIYLKLDHDLEKNLSLYCKLGYLNEKIIFQNLSISGWQLTIGLHVER